MTNWTLHLTVSVLLRWRALDCTTLGPATASRLLRLLPATTGCCATGHPLRLRQAISPDISLRHTACMLLQMVRFCCMVSQSRAPCDTSLVPCLSHEMCYMCGGCSHGCAYSSHPDCIKGQGRQLRPIREWVLLPALFLECADSDDAVAS